MPTKKGLPARLKHKKFGRRYPWREWFAAGSFELVKGKDFTISTAGMRQMVRDRARQFGYSVQTGQSGRGRDVVVTVEVVRRGQ